MITEEERECSRHQVDCKFTFEDLEIIVDALGDYQYCIEDDETHSRELTDTPSSAQVRALMLRVKKYSEPPH